MTTTRKTPTRSTTARAVKSTPQAATPQAAAKSAKPVTKTLAKTLAKTPTATKTPLRARLEKAPKVVTPKAAAPKVEKKSKAEKIKVVRDSFTIPKSEYTRIAELKKRALALGCEVKKSELIRAGLALLVASNDEALRQALAQVPTLKTGRPGKD